MTAAWNGTVSKDGAGGAGVGDPLKRDPAAVLHDVTEERITAEFAREVFGVVIVKGAVDPAATLEARKKLAGNRDPEKPAYLRYFLGSIGVKDYSISGDRILTTSK